MMSSPPSPSHLVEATAGDEDVVADDGAVLLRIEVVAAGAVRGTDLDPVVAFVAERRQVHLAPRMKSLPVPAKVSETPRR